MTTVLDQYVLLDTRELNTFLNASCVDVIITSPPYWDLKDYGSENQIGYGQGKDEYLADIEKFLENCLAILKPTGSMWLIADNYRRDGIVHLLPWEMGERARKVGWTIRDLIVWDKNYNVPWHQKGQLRNTSEFILFMTKSDDYKYYVDRIKELDEISKWWVDFPERFNPKGKTPTNIWSFPIRRRGTWPKPTQVDHFCSLPTALIARIIELTTDPNDLVLDPFAGSGVVLAQAKMLGRHYLGCDINPEYVKMFARTLKEVGNEWGEIQKRRAKYEAAQIDFEQTVMALRALKYTRQVTKPFIEGLTDIQKNNISAILCWAEIPDEYQRDTPINVSISIIVKQYDEIYNLAFSKTLERSKKAPLTHYGINSNIILSTYSDFILNSKKIKSSQDFYLYPLSNTRKFIAKNSLTKWFKNQLLDEFVSDTNIPILANVGVDMAWALDDN